MLCHATSVWLPRFNRHHDLAVEGWDHVVLKAKEEQWIATEVLLLEKARKVRLNQKVWAPSHTPPPQYEEDVIRKISAIWFPSSSAFVCSTRTAMGEEIICVVCASCAARGGHVKAAAAVPQEGHTAVIDEKKKKKMRSKETRKWPSRD